MGKTSVYLSDELTARWKASGLALSELVRRQLDMLEGSAPDLEGTLRRHVRELSALIPLAANGGQPDRRDSDTAADTADTASRTAPTASDEAADTAPHTAAGRKRERKTATAPPPSLPGLPVPLTAASALPGPKQSSCPHRAPRGSWCKLCQAKA